MKTFLTILLFSSLAFAQLSEEVIYQVTSDSFGICQVKKLTYIKKDGKYLNDIPSYHIEIAEPDNSEAFSRIPKEQQDLCKAGWTTTVKARHKALKESQKLEFEKKFGK